MVYEKFRKGVPTILSHEHDCICVGGFLPRCFCEQVRKDAPVAHPHLAISHRVQKINPHVHRHSLEQENDMMRRSAVHRDLDVCYSALQNREIELQGKVQQLATQAITYKQARCALKPVKTHTRYPTLIACTSHRERIWQRPGRRCWRGRVPSRSWTRYRTASS